MKTFEDKMGVVVALVVSIAAHVTMLELVDWAWLPTFEKPSIAGMGIVILCAACMAGFLGVLFAGMRLRTNDLERPLLYLLFMVLSIAASVGIMLGGQMWPTGTFWTVVVLDVIGVLLAIGYIFTNDNKEVPASQNA